MKVLNKVIFSIFLTSLSHAVAKNAVQGEQPIPTKEVVVGLNDVYVPRGFNSDADAYVIVNGIFPNGCYRWLGADVQNLTEFSHEIKSKALVSQGMCIMVLIPFTKEIHLGKMKTGEHTLKFLNGDGTYLEKTLKVE